MQTITLEYNKNQELTFSEALLPKPYTLESLFVIQVDGRSMEPLIQDKALVVADLSQKEFEEGSIYLVFQEQRMWIKKASIRDAKPCFVSLNQGYEHLVYNLGDVRVIAKALLTFTAF